VIRVAVLAAHIQDRDGAMDLCLISRSACPRVERIWADQGYRGGLVDWVQDQYGWRLDIVPKLGAPGKFELEPHRWIVERTFAWLGRERRLSKDYEEWAETSEAWIYTASIRLILRHVAA
jgi:putative transposase